MRILAIIGSAVVLTALGFYSDHCKPVVTLQDCLANPAKYDGYTIEIRQEATVGEVFSDGFTLVQMGDTISVQGRLANLSPGEYVTLRGVFHKEGHLVLEKGRVGRGRRLKMVASLLPLPLVLILLFKDYRFSFRGMEFLPK